MNSEEIEAMEVLREFAKEKNTYMVFYPDGGYTMVAAEIASRDFKLAMKIISAEVDDDATL